eukprot:scaffold2936_cov376-Prasinococcus_capsulatus_cf.AAC.3
MSGGTGDSSSFKRRTVERLPKSLPLLCSSAIAAAAAAATATAGTASSRLLAVIAFLSIKIKIALSACLRSMDASTRCAGGATC